MMTAVANHNGFKLTLDDIDSFNQDQMREQNKANLKKIGGIKAVAQQINTSLESGLTLEEEKSNFKERKEAFGQNKFPEPPMAGFWELWLASFNDPTLIILIGAAIVSFIVGTIEDPDKGWIEGCSILIAVLIVAFVTASNDYSKERQFQALNQVKDEIDVKVIRGSKQKVISTHDLQVGDVVVLEAGDKIPADGLVYNEEECLANESSLTGEPKDITKSAERDPFLLSGCQIVAGRCNMLVMAVGSSSRWGRIKACLATENEDTPLQEKLDEMAKFIGYLGTISAALTFFAMIIVYFFFDEGLRDEHSWSAWIIHAFIVAITIIVVAIPEGLPLAVTISLAYSTRKMLRDNNLIRVLAACETMGNATNICSDKTGTLTENRMTVVEGSIAGRYYPQGRLPTAGSVSPKVCELLKEGISLNSTAVLDKSDGMTKIIGNKTEGALLMFVEHLGGDYLQIRQNIKPFKSYLFSSAKKRMSMLLKLPNGGHRLYSKGASEILLKSCTHMLQEDGTIEMISEAKRAALNETILTMAKAALRTIGIGHRDYGPGDLPSDYEENCPDRGLVLHAIVGIIDPLRADVKTAVRTCQDAGIMVRMVTGDNIHTASAIAKQCGILTEGGIAMEGPDFRTMAPDELDKIIDKLQVLARSSPEDKHTLVTRLNGRLPKDKNDWLKVHAGKSWEDDRDLVLPGYYDEWKEKRRALHLEEEVVGVTGDGTNDAPALKAADVGLSMGLSGTEVAKDASDIVIMDDRFSSIVRAVLWGRSVYDNIRKFLQFQLTVNVVALVLTFIAAVMGFDPPLNPVMMLWVNLIMDTMGALALGTEPPTMALLKRKPYKRTTTLVSRIMWRNIAVQSLYQLGLLMTLLIKGDEWFDVPEGNFEVKDIDGDVTKTIYDHYSIIFNAFVFCQVFNEINARKIGNELNSLKGMHKNFMFIMIIAVTVLLQWFIIQFGGDFTKTAPLTGEQWLITVGLGFVSLPLGFLMRLIPVKESKESFAGYDITPIALDVARKSTQQSISNRGESASTPADNE